jgi:hypothetical protein
MSVRFGEGKMQASSDISFSINNLHGDIFGTVAPHDTSSISLVPYGKNPQIPLQQTENTSNKRKTSVALAKKKKRRAA